MKKIERFLLLCLSFILSITLYASTDKVGTSVLKTKIIGVEGPVLRNIQKNLAASLDQEKTGAQSTISSIHKKNPEYIKEAMQAFGYFKPRILSQLNLQTREATYQVIPGPLLAVAEVRIFISQNQAEAKQIFKTSDWEPLLQLLTLKPVTLLNLKGQGSSIFTVEAYNHSQEKLLEFVREKGYLDAKITHKQVQINLKSYQALILWTLDLGPLYTFGSFSFSKTPLSQAFLKRFNTIQTGTSFSREKLRDLEQVLMESNFFKSVEIFAQPELSVQRAVPVEVKLQPIPSRNYLLGLGYGTDTGIRGQMGLKLPYMSQDGKQLTTLLKASSIYSKLTTNYRIPGRDPAHSYYSFNTDLEHQQQSIGKSRTVSVSTSYVSGAIQKGQKNISLYLVYDQSFNPGGTAWTSSLLFYPSINWLKMVTDDLLMPTRGYRININLIGTPQFLLSNLPFAQAQIALKTLRPLGQKNRVILRAQGGYTYIKDINQLPIKLRFYAGGMQSIRGYGYQTIGPGREMLVTSLEVQRQLRKNFYSSLFLDAGNVSEHALDQVKRSLGIGLVWLSPIGTVELSLSKALDRAGHPLSLQFYIGSEF